MPRMLGTLLCAANALLLASAGAQVQDADELALSYGDQTTVSIATGSRQPLSRAPSVASVITAEDIAAMGASDLDEVLESVPGLHVSRSPNLYSPLYYMRGVTSAYTPQVLMLQNGVPMTTLFIGNKGNIWAGLPLENVARIEVIRGPGSSLYGADAFAGVINIITKTAKEIAGTKVGVRLGSFNSRDAWVQHGANWGDMEMAAYLRIGRTNGADGTISADAQTRSDQRLGTKTSLAPGSINTGRDAVDGNFDLGYGKWRLRSGYKLRDNVETGGGIASALDPVGLAKSERINADLSWTDEQFAQDWSLGGQLSYLKYVQQIPNNFQLYPPGVTFPTGTFPNGMIGGPSTWERQLRMSGFATYNGWLNHKLRLGLGRDNLNLYQTQEFKNYIFSATGVPIPTGPVNDYTAIAPFMLPHSRMVTYLYIQDEWQFARDWTLTAGIRRDNYSDVGGTTNPRLALVWNTSYNLTTKLLYGRAFRAPAFAEQYSINNPVARGNPSLLPETNNTLEAALAWQPTDGVQVNFNVFRYQMKDIIRTVANPVPAPGATYANTGGQNGKGFELEGTWDVLRSLRLTGNYSAQRTSSDANGQDAGLAPGRRLFTRADWRFAPRWQLAGMINHVSDRKRQPGDTRAAVADYTTVDVSLNRESFADGWDARLTVRNLFDKDAREPTLAPGNIPYDLPLPGRTVTVQIQHAL